VFRGLNLERIVTEMAFIKSTLNPVRGYNTEFITVLRGKKQIVLEIYSSTFF